MKFRRNLRRADPGLDITPLIDVVFLLLIFFVVTTSFARDTRLVIALPEAQGERSELPPELIEIRVDTQGAYTVNGRPLADASLDTLMRALRDSAGGDLATPLLISADAQTSHQAVVTAMDAAARLGFSRLNIATREPDAGTRP